MLKIVGTLPKGQTRKTMPTWANMIPLKDQEVPKKPYLLGSKYLYSQVKYQYIICFLFNIPSLHDLEIVCYSQCLYPKKSSNNGPVLLNYVTLLVCSKAIALLKIRLALIKLRLDCLVNLFLPLHIFDSGFVDAIKIPAFVYPKKQMLWVF